MEQLVRLQDSAIQDLIDRVLIIKEFRKDEKRHISTYVQRAQDFIKCVEQRRERRDGAGISAAAEHDPVMAWRFFDVTGFDAPTATLFSPDTLRRLAQDRRHHRRTAAPTRAMAAAKGWTWP